MTILNRAKIFNNYEKMRFPVRDRKPHQTESNTAEFKHKHSGICFSAKLVIILVADGLQPFIGTVFPGNLNRQMRELAVGCRSVPMLNTDGNVYYVSQVKLLRFLSPFLIISLSGKTDEDLSSAFIRVMDMPVISAARLKGYVENADLFCGNRSQVALSDTGFMLNISISRIPISSTRSARLGVCEESPICRIMPCDFNFCM